MRPLQRGKKKIARVERPNLSFGKVRVANKSVAVDEIQQKLGGIATIFVKAGAEFIRISTNF
ncbi:MAG: hypothetical protein EXS34_02160 [Lacunisphaera sp.]|nr:hypothetical protein [Lacunisphaera sp.]